MEAAQVEASRLIYFQNSTRKRMKEQHYTIQEYNRQTQKYITIGEASGTSPEAAKLKFIEQTNWKSRRNIILFAQHPICR